MKVSVSVLGRFHAFYLAQQLLKREALCRLLTSYPRFEVINYGIPNEKIEISYDPDEAREMASFGKHTPATGIIRVVAKNRNLADVLRTLAHELVHRKQEKEGRLYVGAGADGTDIENEANAEAAVIMRRFGKANPIIFE